MKPLALSVISSVALLSVSGCAQVQGLFGREQAAAPVSIEATSPATALAPTEMIGKSVITTAGSEIGEVEDVLMTRGGDPSMVVISSGGFMGLGGRDVAVSLDEFRYTSARDALVATNMTEDQFAALPEYQETGDMLSLRQSQ